MQLWELWDDGVEEELDAETWEKHDRPKKGRAWEGYRRPERGEGGLRGERRALVG